MNGIRSSAALALVGVMALTSPAIARDQAQASNSASTQNEQKPAARSMAVENLLRKFAGEWEGRLEMRTEGRASISIVSVSSRFDTKNERFESVFQGFAFGKPFDCAQMFGMNAEGAPSKYWWTSNFEQKGSSWSWQVAEDGRAVIGMGREHQGSLATRYEHVMTYVDDDQYEVEWFDIQPNGDRERVAKMTLSRMNRGERADASEVFQDGTFSDWSAKISGAQAQVRDND